ncbi:MAG TPA: ABC transporter ATP-binding protein [Verrucomicrobiales bacterium]|jgi:ABC-2 type transport system ATP-binding protein|nr:ABC transporter ATP-binding protein [Verrucomicrobiales bacterium]
MADRTVVLEASGLSKAYGTLRAVDGISFVLHRGESAGLLGPNGAGKSTAIAMIMGHVTPDAGIVNVEGSPLTGDSDDRKRRLGLVPQDLAIYEDLTALENLRYFGALYGLRGRELDMRMEAVLEIAGLRDRAKDRAGSYSGGMKRRLNLAAALLHDPQILLLDEPTVGVDPQSRNGIFDAIEALRAEGKTILYTTHYMEEVERLCHRAMIMDHGRLIADDTVANLKARGLTGSRLLMEMDTLLPESVRAEIAAIPGVQEVSVEGHRLTVETGAFMETAPALLELLRARGTGVRHMETESASLEHVFLALTGRTLRDP